MMGRRLLRAALLLGLAGCEPAAAAVAPGLTLRVFDNNGRAGNPIRTAVVPTAEIQLDPAAPLSAELLGTLTFPAANVFEFHCHFQRTSLAFVWVDGHLVCHDGNGFNDSAAVWWGDNPLPIAAAATTLPFRAHLYYNASAPAGAGDVALRVLWAARGGPGPVGIPSSALAPALPEVEERRDALQRDLAQGWGSWLHHDIATVVKLPEGAAVATRLCRRSSGECIEFAIPDRLTRVGLHAPDRSYVQYYFGPNGTVKANVSVEYRVSGLANEKLQLLVTPVDCGAPGASCDDYEIVATGRHAWFRAGTVAVAADRLRFESAGLGLFDLLPVATDPSAVSASGAALRLSLALGPVGLSTEAGASVSSVRAALDETRKAEAVRLDALFGERAAVAAAVHAAVMWTVVYTPAENGPLMPVSRDWNFVPSATTADFTYVVFDWDNFFASLLAGLEQKALAYSNLFQVVKSKTAGGFIPNFSAAGHKSQDRTEPPVGAKVVLELYKKYGDAWVVEVVYQDLLDWLGWFLRQRLLQPAGLIALGSFSEFGVGEENNMQDARYESGLDNSPMYDGEFFDNVTTHLMQMYDVGMNSMWVQDARALAELADVIGRPEGPKLRALADAMAGKIRDTFWDEQAQVFANRFPNGTFYERVSPTSFYPMMAEAATDAQAEVLATAWLMNTTRFCISPTGDFAGNSDACYWGLPSISADDPAFPPLGYWRGYVWGPMAMLTFWSLQRYNHVPAVRQGRKALCSQMQQLLMSQWDAHRHVCENFNPHKTADTSGGDCSGSKFYHWGALTGLIGMIEDGYWSAAPRVELMVA